MTDGNSEPVEVFLGPNRKTAVERAIVLQAAGIPHELSSVGRGVAIRVPRGVAERALAELGQYEAENLGWPPPRQQPPMLSRGVEGTIGYAVILLLFIPIGRSGLLGMNWWEAGKLVAGKVTDGELWRTVTALCLHGDAAHVIGNLVFGAAFGVLAAHTLGVGLTWAGTLAAGMLGNLANAWLQDPTHASIGASTAVFGCLGMMAAYEGIRRRTLHLSSMRQLAPLLAAAALLGFFGAGGNEVPGGARTDVVAHVTGMAAGCLIGVLFGLTRLPERVGPRTQLMLALAVPLALALSWSLALS